MATQRSFLWVVFFSVAGDSPYCLLITSLGHNIVLTKAYEGPYQAREGILLGKLDYIVAGYIRTRVPFERTEPRSLGVPRKKPLQTNAYPDHRWLCSLARVRQIKTYPVNDTSVNTSDECYTVQIDSHTSYSIHDDRDNCHRFSLNYQ